MRNCWHGVVAARLPSERPDSVINCFKNIYCVGCTFIVSVTVDEFGTNIKLSVVGRRDYRLTGPLASPSCRGKQPAS